MENTQEELKAHLMAADPEYRRLAEEHATYDAQIAKLEHKSPFTLADEDEEHRLKKLKLAIKDQMNAIIARQAQAV